MNELPNYEELPRNSEGIPSGWGIFGATDNLGLVNLLTPERVVSASRLIRKGSVFPLNAPVDMFRPSLSPSRSVVRHTLVHAENSAMFDDFLDDFYPQASSQWDSLAHAGYDVDVFYNDASEEDILSGRRNTIDHWARRGIVGRAVLLDMVRSSSLDGRDYDPATATAFDAEDLERARRRNAGVEFETGDILLLHTGYSEWYRNQSPAVHLELSGTRQTTGIAHTEAVCRYLWDHHVAAIGADNWAVEVTTIDSGPDASPFGFLHRILIGQFGMALGELWWLKELADDCAADGVYEMFFVSSPLNVPGGIGSPANTIAIK